MSYENPTTPNNNENKVVSIERYKKEKEKVLRVKEIMGEDFLGRSEVEKALGTKINPETIPEVPFSEEELERAKELGQFLILRVDKTSDGDPLTIEKINNCLRGKVSDGGKVLFYDDKTGNIEKSAWYKNERFVVEETPTLNWVLTSKDIVPNSNGKNYLEQTEEIANYLKNEVFKGRDLPFEYEEAIQEFEEKKEEINKILKSDWKLAAESLANLLINKLARPSAVEVFYDLIVYFQNRGERLLNDVPRYTWTTSLKSNNELIKAGYFTSSGVSFSSSGPDGTDSYSGTYFSRAV